MLTHLSWRPFCNIYVCRIITLYNLNLHNVICQVYLTKAGGGKGMLSALHKYAYKLCSIFQIDWLQNQLTFAMSINTDPSSVTDIE